MAMRREVYGMCPYCGGGLTYDHKCNITHLNQKSPQNTNILTLSREELKSLIKEIMQELSELDSQK